MVSAALPKPRANAEEVTGVEWLTNAQDFVMGLPSFVRLSALAPTCAFFIFSVLLGHLALIEQEC